MFSPIRCFIATLLALTSANAATPPTRFVLRVFTVSKDEGMALLAQDLSDRDLFQKLSDAAKQNPAVLEKLIVVNGRCDDDIEVQLADELRYPTEFDPQQLPRELLVGDSALGAALQSFFKPDPDPAPAPTPPAPPAEPKNKDDHPGLDLSKPKRAATNGGLGIITSITPSAFEMRPLGDHLTLTSMSEDNGKLSAQCHYANTKLAGFRTYNGESQPAFVSRQVTCPATLMPDQPCFLGTCTAPQKTGTEFDKQDTGMSFAFLTMHRAPVAEKNSGWPETDLMARFEVISVPKLKAASLIDANPADPDLRHQLKNEIKAGDAKLESHFASRLRAGSTVIGATDDHLYPTEFDPPQIPQTMAISDTQLLADLRSGKQPVPSSSDTPHSAGFGFMTTATPMAFEQRKVGSQIEIEITHDNDDGWITETKPELTRLLGDIHFAGVPQPLYESQRLTTQVPVTLGAPRLLGTLSRPVATGMREGNQDDRTWFAFITLTEAK